MSCESDCSDEVLQIYDDILSGLQHTPKNLPGLDFRIKMQNFQLKARPSSNVCILNTDAQR